MCVSLKWIYISLYRFRCISYSFSFPSLSHSNMSSDKLYQWHDEGHLWKEDLLSSCGDKMQKSSLGHRNGHTISWSYKNTPLDQLLHEINSKNKENKAWINVNLSQPCCHSCTVLKCHFWNSSRTKPVSTQQRSAHMDLLLLKSIHNFWRIWVRYIMILSATDMETYLIVQVRIWISFYLHVETYSCV